MKDKLNKKEVTTWTIAILIFGLATGCWLLFGDFEDELYERDEELILRFPKQPPPQKNLRGKTSFSGAAYRVRPSVVSICTTGVDKGAAGFHLESIGTGTIVSPLGYILTGLSVVRGRKEVQVVMFEPTHYEGTALEQRHHHIYDAHVTDVFPASGVAIVRINGSALPFANMRKGEGTRLGDWCMGVGAPLGREVLASSGLVNATNRTKKINGMPCKGLLEISCKGTRDMIGGPLVDKRGEVIGIIVTRKHAVPANKAMDIMHGVGIPVM